MSSKNKLETWGNETTMNLNNLVYSNILTSPYFKALM
jgi:pre-mRNA-splicing factor 38B